MPASKWMSFNHKGRGLFIRFSPTVVGGHDSGLYSPLARVIPAEPESSWTPACAGVTEIGWRGGLIEVSAAERSDFRFCCDFFRFHA